MKEFEEETKSGMRSVRQILGATEMVNSREKDYDTWNEVKKYTETREIQIDFKERDIFFIHLGQNIGHEQSGKGKSFLRPVLVLKKFNERIFLGVPLTKRKKLGKYYYELVIGRKKGYAIISQIRLFDKKRFHNKLGTLTKVQMNGIKIAIIRMLL